MPTIIQKKGVRFDPNNDLILAGGSIRPYGIFTLPVDADATAGIITAESYGEEYTGTIDFEGDVGDTITLTKVD